MKITDDMLTEWRQQFEAIQRPKTDLSKEARGGRYKNPVVQACWETWQAARRTTPDRETIELREAARQFYNMTNGDPMVRISAPSAEKRDAIYDAAKRLRALLELTAPTSDKGGA
ncbi:hypothetical protein [Burkholderia pseudomallei]|uniref:hypothetical protein n=1 Tax=Burkholderia pseudomallei TaxID=28450 RepID=UPI0013235370|nr:hypothetical protein [Burkholderia pseudomallei]MWA18066.1 hypothetical protein [Burkholderia pseudomallei]